MAVENIYICSIGDVMFLLKTSIPRGCSIAMFDYQRVRLKLQGLVDCYLKYIPEAMIGDSRRWSRISMG